MLKYSDIPDAKKLEVKKYIGEIGSEHISRIVVEKVKEKFNVIIDERSVRYILQRIRESLKDVGETLEKAIEEVNEQEEKKYEILEKDGKLCYKLDAGKSLFVIPVEEIDAMFKDYSSKGANMSGEQMRQKYNLKPQAWATIKNRLSLVKDSHIYSPYTLENSSEEEVDEMIEKGIEEHIDTKIGKFVKSYDKQFKEKALKAMKTVANFQYQLDMIQETIAIHEPLELDFTPNYKPNGKESHFILTDIHIGKNDTAWVIRRLDQLYQDIIADPADIIHITCLWDLVESFSENWMHPWQLAYGTEQKYGYGFDLIMNTVDIFEKWLQGIAKEWKTVYFKGLGGNHDRMTIKNEDDIYRSWALVVYELIKRGVSNLWIEVEYFKEHINTFIADNIQYIVSHWEWPFSRQKPEQIIVAHAQTWIYTVMLSWHTHALQFTEWKNFTKVVVPALAWQGKYDKQLNLHSEPAYLKVNRNQHNTADITIKRLSK